MFDMKTILTGCAILTIALIVLLTPYILNTAKLNLFMKDKFNMMLLILVNIVVFLYDIKLGVIVSILLLSLFSYGTMEGLTFSNPNFYTTEKEEETYEKQFDLMASQIPDEHSILAKKIETFDHCDKKEGFQDEENTGYDVVSCRYDMTQGAQNTTLNGPPLGLNDTYKTVVNGQMFYPMHG